METVPDVVHVHDSAASFTFFTNEVRTTLREALQAMWRAERHLAIGALEDALPHENTALRLLKEVQRAARVYVDKVGFEPTPLDPERDRFSGDDLDEVVKRRDELRPFDDHELDILRHALDAALGRSNETEALSRAATLVAQRAVDDASIDPAMVDALRAAARGGSTERAVAILWDLMPTPTRGPRGASFQGTLADRYRSHLDDTGPPP